MSDELNNKEQEQIQEEQVQEKVDEVVKTPEVVEETTEEPKAEDPQVEEEDSKVEEVPEEKEIEEQAPVEESESEKGEVEEQKPESEEPEVVEEKVEEQESSQEEKQEDVPPATEEVEEPTKEEPDIEEIKNQLAEREAELAEEKAVKAYEDDVREANSQLDTFLNNLGNAMVQEFKRYGIDPNSNLDELREKDPAKANVAERIIKQAQEVKARVMQNVQNNLNERLTDVIFDKASRLLDKFKLSAEEAQIAAETFIDILDQSGIRDMGEDLAAKVELAVARAKLIAPKVEAVGEQVQEIVEDVKEAVEDVKEETAHKEKQESEVVEEENKEEKPSEETEESKPEEKQEEVPPTSTIEKPSLDEFTESAVTSTQAQGDVITEANVMQKMAELPFKQRTTFYKEHRDLIEKAAKSETIRRAGNNKV